MALAVDRAVASLRSSVGPPIGRTASRPDAVKLPEGTVVISADTHICLCEDIWVDGFPADMRDKAPRVWKADGVWHIGFGGRSVFPPHFAQIMAGFDTLPGATRIEPRLRDMDSEGISQEIAFPNAVLAFLHYPDHELRALIYAIYNRHLATLEARSGGRFHGVGIPNFWDMSRARDSIQEIKALGLRTLMLPQYPGKDVQGRPSQYSSSDCAPLWAAIEEAELPVCFHIGETHNDEPGGLGLSLLINFGGFRQALGQLIFGGIFDRHPGLRVVFAEAGITWAASALQDAEVVLASVGALSKPGIARSPRDYWRTHCYTTFMADPIGLRNIDEVGVDRVMWGTDYPHYESTFGYSSEAMQAVVESVSADSAKMILGGTARRVFNL